MESHGRRGTRLTAWCKAQFNIVKGWLAITEHGREGPLKKLRGDAGYLAGVSKHAPMPPIGDLSDIMIMSPRVRSSDCLFKSGSYNDSRTTATLRIVPKDRIDRTLVALWLSECVENHNLYVGETQDNNLALLLVDVQKKCLVLTSGAQYFALSYVWGKADQFLLKQENLLDFSQDGALHRH
jgi:hypothetical protein